MSELSDLQARLPFIAWEEPIAITTPAGGGYECRVCLAAHGKRGSDAPTFETPEAVREHIRATHS